MSRGSKPSQEPVFDQQSLGRRLTLLMTGLIAIAVIAVGLAAIASFERAVAPELRNRAQLIGSIVRIEVQRILELGIPIDAVAGLDDYLHDILTDFEEIDEIALTDATNRLIAHAIREDREPRLTGVTSGLMAPSDDMHADLPILRGNQIVGNLAIEINPIFVATRLRDVFMDIGVLLLIAVLIATELVLAVVVSSVTKPLARVQRLLDEQRAGTFVYTIRQTGLLGLRRTAARLSDHAVDLTARVRALPQAVQSRVDATFSGSGSPTELRLSDFNDIRLAIFLFSAATEISVAFLPIYAAEAVRPDWLTLDLAAAMPIIFYLAAIAAVAPFGGRLVRLVGARRLFAISVPGATLALVGVGLSQSILAITFWHGAMAGFYAVATISGQEYAVRAGGPQRSGTALGAYVSVIYGGLFFGSVLGGLIAGRFGFATAFFVGAILSAISLGLGLLSMTGRAGDRETDRSQPAQAVRERKRWFSIRYLALLLGVAVPMNATMVIFIWYLTPLMLSDLGNEPADIVRVLLLYYVAILFLGPRVAGMSDGWPGPVPLIMAGATISGLGLLAVVAIGGFWAIAAAVGMVGIGQVMTATPLYAYVLRITGGPGPGMDNLRLIERVGSIVALLGSTVLIVSIGVTGSLLLLAVLMLAGIGMFAIVAMAAR